MEIGYEKKTRTGIPAEQQEQRLPEHDIRSGRGPDLPSNVQTVYRRLGDEVRDQQALDRVGAVEIGCEEKTKSEHMGGNAARRI